MRYFVAYMLLLSASAVAQDAGEDLSVDDLTPEELAQLKADEEAFKLDPRVEALASVTSKYTEPVTDSPASVFVITRAQIERGGYRAIGEVLSLVPGVYVSYDLINYHVAMRGALGGARAGSRFLKIMVDGVPMPMQQSETYLLGPEFIPLTAVERIEVLRGPASSLYGAGAYVGAINIVTKRGVYTGTDRAHMSATLTGGVGGLRTGGLDASLWYVGKNLHVLGGLGITAEDRSGLSVRQTSAFTLGDNGFVKGPSPFDARYSKDDIPFVSENDSALLGNLFLKVDANLLGGVARVFGLSQLSLRHAEFFDISKFTHKSSINLSNSKVGASFERPFSNNVSMRVAATFGVGRSLPGDQLRLQPTDTNVIRRDFSSYTVNGLAELRYDIDGGGYVLAGIDSYFDYENLPLLTEVDDDGTTKIRAQVPPEQFFNAAAFLHGGIPVGFLKLSGGGRVDFNSIVGVAGAARAGAVVRLSDQLSLKLMGGSSYKAPSPEQLFTTGVVGAIDIYGNPNAKPQYLFGAETAVDYAPIDWLTLSMSGFYNYYYQVLSYISTGGELRAVNYDANNVGGELAARGVCDFFDSELALELEGNLSMQYTAVAEIDFGGFIAKDVPDNEGVPIAVSNVVMGALIPSAYTHMQVEYRFVSQRNPSQSNLLENGTSTMSAPNYLLGAGHFLSAVVSTTPIDFGAMKVTGALRVTNILGLALPSQNGGVPVPLVQNTEIGFNGIDVPTQPATAFGSIRMEF